MELTVAQAKKYIEGKTVHTMWCPDCDYEYRCPCEHCTKRYTGTEPQWIELGEIKSCPRCGLTKHVDAWLDVEYEQYTFLRKLGFIKDNDIGKNDEHK